jgi:hypothetical protein
MGRWLHGSGKMHVGCPDIVMYLFFSGAELRQIDANVCGGSHGGIETALVGRTLSKHCSESGFLL